MAARSAKLNRQTKETDVSMELNLDGTGKATVLCDEQFLRHMLETFARYSSFDLEVQAKGDNDHHLVEDVAIVLGQALREALGEAPVERIASAVVPMDDALVEVDLDIVDRLYHHFLRSFAMSSGITLHVIIKRGFDDHHMVEATFKALGTALRRATAKRETVLSTKDRPKVRRG